MSDIVVVSAVRTALGTPVGALSPLGAGGLGDVVVEAAIARAGLAAAAVDTVIFADAIGATAGATAAPGGGLRALMRAADRLSAGDADVVVAAARHGASADAAARDAALAAVEAIAARGDLTRVELESFALTSRLRAAAALRDGRFADEIVPVRAGAVTVARDETVLSVTGDGRLPDPCPAEPGAPKASLAALAPVALGGAALVLTRAEVARRRGLPILARLVGAATASAALAAPEATIADAARAATESARWRPEAVDLVEIDEISAAHVLTTWRDLGIDLARLDVLGGALGLGAPGGASDLRMVVTLVHELRRRGLRTGLAAGETGGLGRAICVERI